MSLTSERTLSAVRQKREMITANKTHSDKWGARTGSFLYGSWFYSLLKRSPIFPKPPQKNRRQFDESVCEVNLRTILF